MLKAYSIEQLSFAIGEQIPEVSRDWICEYIAHKGSVRAIYDFSDFIHYVRLIDDELIKTGRI